MLRPVFALLSASIALSACSPEAIVVDAGADAPIDAASTSSGGSGGLACERIGVVDGLTYCVATVAGVELKILPPEATDGPLDLAIYLHGDGARAYASDTVLRIQGAWARSRRTLYVAALAPNGCAWWLRPSYTGCDGVVGPDDPDVLGENAEALAAAIEALRGGWDLRNDPILFGGSSGGAVFLSGSFLPRFGDRYHGVFALACGGERHGRRSPGTPRRSAPPSSTSSTAMPTCCVPTSKRPSPRTKRWACPRTPPASTEASPTAPSITSAG